MDETDLGILKALKRNSRESLGDISKELGVSKATVSRRLAALEADGVISSYTANMNLSKLGLMKAIISLQVQGSAMSSVVEELKRSPEIETVHRAFGDHSLVCQVYTVSVDMLYNMIQNRILTMSGVQNVEVDILIDTIVVNADAQIGAGPTARN